MKYANLSQEKSLWKRGYRNVAGLDEAGRGPLAGPVVAGIVVVKKYKLLPKYFHKVRDSKKLNANQRDSFYKLIVRDKNLLWGRGLVSARAIDRINILQATKLAMVRAISHLHSKTKALRLDYLILDGKMNLDIPIAQKSIIKADEKVLSCALASIIAKVTRDRLMKKLHRKYPQFRFDLNKGYGSRLHFRRLKRHGACPVHRQTFYPVSAIVKM